MGNLLHTSIHNYYLKHAQLLTEKSRFHFFSRMYLWTKKSVYLKELHGLKDAFIGKDPKKILQEIAKKTTITPTTKKEIIPYLKKYPKIRIYNELLFRTCPLSFYQNTNKTELYHSNA